MRLVRPLLVAAALLAATPGVAPALEAFNGRLQLHGSLSEEIRVIGDGYRVRDHNWFLSKMATKLSLEFEAELFPDGIGPFDIVEAFARVDVQYDCVFEHACHMARQWNYFGDDARRAPENISNGRTRGVTGVLPNPLNPIVREQPSSRLASFADFDPFSTLLTLGSPEDIQRTFGDELLEAKFTSKHVKGSLHPLVSVLGPIDPGTHIDSTGSLAGVPVPDQKALPFRPATPSLFIPSAGLTRFIDDYDNPDVNFTENELAWNRGASQQQTKELKEAYLDIVMAEGRLQLRLGKQITRWGKTELFRSGTPDQLNPQDVAVSNLPSFEESLIALWQARAVYSFYDVGPFQDLRLELAVNLDNFEPADIGDCGEPYAVFLVCQKQYGLFAHGFSGLGIAGELRPPAFYESGTGFEFGARVEFRIGRFSIAITDFYGYDDFPTPDYFHEYDRNVDPNTGRPRISGATGACVTGNEPACLNVGNALAYHSGNRQLYDTTCSATQNLVIPGNLGNLLPITSCVISIFNNPDPIPGLGNVPAVLGQTLADGDFFNGSAACLVFCNILGKTFGGGDPSTATIPLHPGRNDAVQTGATSFTGFLSPEQQALLGCGPFYQTDCNVDGIDLFNLEASVLYQAFPQSEHGGIPLNGAIATRFIPGVGTIQLPGARSVFTYFSDPVGYRWDPTVDGCVVGLTNLGAYGAQVRADLISRGISAANADQCDDDPADGAGVGYLVPIPDGANPGNRINFDNAGPSYTVEQIRTLFPTEMAIVSENLVRLLAGISGLIDPDSGCSVAAPTRCEFLNGLFETSAVQRPEFRAGGNGRYGRRDMTWLAGSEIQLFYERRNVLGVSVDFTEDWSKTAWGMDFTWIEDAPYINQRADRGFSREDTLNLTISVDRPTFINFLNANRTIFFNAQLFLRYIPNYERRDTFEVDGPVAALATFTAFTGFWQDRLNAFLTLIHEVESNSGGQIFTVSYRFSESFSATVGLSTFYGSPRRSRVLERSPLTRFTCCDATQRSNYQGVSPLTERDELFFTLRKTF